MDYTGFGRLLVFGSKVTIRCIFIDNYLGGGRSAWPQSPSST